MQKSDEVQRVVGIDWSGRVDAAGQRRHIWAGVWTKGEDGAITVDLEAGHTHRSIVPWLIAKVLETPKMVVGIDFCFSYPAWFVRELGATTAPEFWQIVSGGKGEEWLGKDCADGRFWGRPGKKNIHFSGDGATRMFRNADRACKIRSEIFNVELRDRIKGIAPKSPFQIGGAGAVGTGSLRGIPMLHELREAGFSVWPFDVPKLPVLLEIYPRLLTGEVRKSQAQGRREYLQKKQAEKQSYASLSSEVIAKALASEDAFDALVSVMEMAERRASFLELKQATDEKTLLEGAVWGASG